jgi:transcriptional regulator with XRE-family HTH domain
MKSTIPDQHQKRLDSISIYLRELRFAEGMTQSEVCEELGLGLHKNTLQRVEDGYNMNLTTLFEIADFYGIPISEMFEDIK